ncbi:uncharacterized protein IUM83_15324 [Phytophthora cinnamomi]|uniref:uncharacterized protein n=1 Tax=Phytophthora cinnamomi TaxID=4785 RepID=UPI003559F2EB|nr:hypothetical protein IUM83_15324 [Phytophthora cinnamomi]
MEHLMHRSSDEEGAARAPEFQLIRRKRPRTPESGGESPFAFPARGSPEKAPRLMVLPGLAELLAAQKQRNEGVAADALLDVLSRASSAEQEQQQQQSQQQQQHEEEIEVEDKTPWPSAKQYFDIFSVPKSELKIPVYDLGVDPRGVPLHPEFIYSQPVSCMYFLKCSRLLGKGSFGFPRKKKSAGETTPTATPTAKKPAGKAGKKESSKDFEWRKMSFVTGLPKKQPIVRYITATCYSRATDVAAKKKVFRMHAVMLADEAGTGEQGEYVLVHIRAGGSKRVGLRASLADAETQQAPASPGAHGTPTAKQNADLLCMRRPVSPTSVAVSSYSSSTASTSPRNKKLLHAEFASAQGQSSDHLARVLSGSPGFPMDTMPSMTRHPLFTAAEDPKVDSARQALRNMILKSCTSRDEMAKYVMGLQEELAALQNQ